MESGYLLLLATEKRRPSWHFGTSPHGEPDVLSVHLPANLSHHFRQAPAPQAPQVHCAQLLQLHQLDLVDYRKIESSTRSNTGRRHWGL